MQRELVERQHEKLSGRRKIMFHTLKSLNSSVGDERNGTVKSFLCLFYFDPQSL